jgi:hypothetical protein
MHIILIIILSDVIIPMTVRKNYFPDDGRRTEAFYKLTCQYMDHIRL